MEKCGTWLTAFKSQGWVYTALEMADANLSTSEAESSLNTPLFLLNLELQTFH